METIVQIIDIERLFSIFDIPRDIWAGQVEVTIRPIEKKSNVTTAGKIAQFKKKYNRELFIEHLKEQADKGISFNFNVQKVIDGTENEEETQARYRLEKQTWGNTIRDALGGDV